MSAEALLAHPSCVNLENVLLSPVFRVNKDLIHDFTEAFRQLVAKSRDPSPAVYIIPEVFRDAKAED